MRSNIDIHLSTFKSDYKEVEERVGAFDFIVSTLNRDFAQYLSNESTGNFLSIYEDGDSSVWDIIELDFTEFRLTHPFYFIIRHNAFQKLAKLLLCHEEVCVADVDAIFN